MCSLRSGRGGDEEEKGCLLFGTKKRRFRPLMALLPTKVTTIVKKKK